MNSLNMLTVTVTVHSVTAWVGRYIRHCMGGSPQTDVGQPPNYISTSTTACIPEVLNSKESWQRQDTMISRWYFTALPQPYVHAPAGHCSDAPPWVVTVKHTQIPRRAHYSPSRKSESTQMIYLYDADGEESWQENNRSDLHQILLDIPLSLPRTIIC